MVRVSTPCQGCGQMVTGEGSMTMPAYHPGCWAATKNVEAAKAQADIVVRLREGLVGAAMTLEERAAAIADKSMGAARGKERRRRIYEEALKMLRDVAAEARPIAPPDS